MMSNTPTFTQIASEGQTVAVEPGAVVRYGASSTDAALFIERTITAGGQVTASNAFFGADPARGRAKFLWLLDAAQAPSPAPEPPAPTEPGVYAYTGPIPLAPGPTSTDAQWLRYFEVQRLLAAAAASVASKLERESRDEYARQQKRVADGFATLAQAVATMPSPIIGATPPGLRECALRLMLDLPRVTGQSADQLAERAVKEAEALLRATPDHG
jgi:hypothetical protein